MSSNSSVMYTKLKNKCLDIRRRRSSTLSVLNSPVENSSTSSGSNSSGTKNNLLTSPRGCSSRGTSTAERISRGTSTSDLATCYSDPATSRYSDPATCSNVIITCSSCTDNSSTVSSSDYGNVSLGGEVETDSGASIFTTPTCNTCTNLSNIPGGTGYLTTAPSGLSEGASYGSLTSAGHYQETASSSSYYDDTRSTRSSVVEETASSSTSYSAPVAAIVDTSAGLSAGLSAHAAPLLTQPIVPLTHSTFTHPTVAPVFPAHHQTKGDDFYSDCAADVSAELLGDISTLLEQPEIGDIGHRQWYISGTDNGLYQTQTMVYIGHRQ